MHVCKYIDLHVCVSLQMHIACAKKTQCVLVQIKRACVCVCPRPPPFRSEASVMVLQRSGFFRGWYLAAGHV